MLLCYWYCITFVDCLVFVGGFVVFAVYLGLGCLCLLFLWLFLVDGVWLLNYGCWVLLSGGLV